MTHWKHSFSWKSLWINSVAKGKLGSTVVWLFLWFSPLPDQRQPFVNTTQILPWACLSPAISISPRYLSSTIYPSTHHLSTHPSICPSLIHKPTHSFNYNLLKLNYNLITRIWSFVNDSGLCILKSSLGNFLVVQWLVLGTSLPGCGVQSLVCGLKSRKLGS